MQEIGHIGDGLIDFYDSVQGLADQIERDAEELRLLLIEQAKSVLEELEQVPARPGPGGEFAV